MEKLRKTGQPDMDSMHVIRDLSKRCFRKNKLRNIVGMLTIAVLAMLFTALLLLSENTILNLKKALFLQHGTDAHGSFYDLTWEEAGRLEPGGEVKAFGKSALLALCDQGEENDSPLEIRWGNTEYLNGRFIQAIEGRLPEHGNEVALDRGSLERMGVVKELGAHITLRWMHPVSRSYVESEFILTGITDGNGGEQRGIAWVSGEFAKSVPEQGRRVDADVYFKNKKDITRNMEELIQSIGNDQVLFEENWLYSPSVTAYFVSHIKTFLIAMVLVAISASLIIYNIFQISISIDFLFYGRLKTLGATPKQISRVLYGQINKLCFLGIPIGAVIGYQLGRWLVPVLLGSLKYEAGTEFSFPIIFLGAAAAYAITVLAACRPIIEAGKISPADALKRAGMFKQPKDRRRGEGSPGILFQMGLLNLGRTPRRTVIAIFSLSLGMVLLCSIYAVSSGFDMKKYMEEFTVSDFTVTRELGGGDSVAEGFIGDLEKQKGVIGTGSLYSKETKINLSSKAYKNLIDFYEADKKERLNYMSYDTLWSQGYQNMRNTRTTSALIHGIEGIPLEVLTKSAYMIEGKFDQQKFSEGGYAIAEGVASDRDRSKNQPTYGIGDTVIIDGEQFEIMAIVSSLKPLNEGKYSDASAFSLAFYISEPDFKNLYPDKTPVKYFLDVENEELAYMDRYIESRKGDALEVISKRTLMQDYRDQTRASTVMWRVISITIVVIGMINLINTMITSILERRKELAVMQSIGLSKTQLLLMFLYEGLCYSGCILLISYVCSYVAVSFGVRRYLSTIWASTYQFTIQPLVICTPVIIMVSVLIPVICYKLVLMPYTKARLSDSAEAKLI